jgi:hypothetical protein
MLSDHDKVVLDTASLIESELPSHGITDYTITVDVGPGGKKANTIPGAHRDGNGRDGVADIIVWTDDKVYVWEVKSSGGKAKVNGEWISNKELGPVQVNRYINKLQDKLDAEGTGQEVVAGFGLPSSVSVSANGKHGETMRTWSGKKGTEDGLRYYAYNKPKKRQKQPQEQEQPQEAPCEGVAPACYYVPFPSNGRQVPIPGRVPSIPKIRIPFLDPIPG